MTKQQWRRMWFQVHKWIGLILAILIIPLSLSGAALVWPGAIDRLANPVRYATSGDALIAPAAYVQAARAVLKPGDRVAMLTLPDGSGPVIVSASPGKAQPSRGGPPARTNVYLDPPTARVLDVAGSASGLMRTIHMLHGNLLVSGWGRTVVGWIGVAMMCSCFTGLWLWWPTMGKWVRGLRWRRHRNFDTNLHHLMGFWIALPLFVLSLTGAWIAFPGVFGALVGQSAGGPDRRAMRAPPMAAPARSLEAVLSAAGRESALQSLAWPTESSPDWTVTFASGKGVKVADDTGTPSAAPERSGGVARWMRRIHDGDDMGPVWQAIIFVGGILPALLAITGVIMWWRARRWRGDLARRRIARS